MSTTPVPGTSASPSAGGSDPSALQQLVQSRVRAQLGAPGEWGTQLDRAARVALRMFGVRLVRVSLLGSRYQWDRDGGQAQELSAAERDVFDHESHRTNDILIVVDASRDPRFRQDPLVTEAGGIRFFASAPISDPRGRRVGSLRLVDSQPRVLTEPELFILLELIDQIEKDVAYRQELEQAAAVQRSLSPRPFSALPGYEVSGLCSPARMVGGDFYDWYPTPQGAAFTLADVMGKGVGAAIIAATVRAVMRSGAKKDSIADVLDASAAALDTDADGTPGFVTLFHARLDAASGALTFVDAGHGLAIIVDGETRTSRRLVGSDLPLGIGQEGQWVEHSAQLDPGDSLVVVSDGVLDFFNGSPIALEEVEAIVLESTSSQEAVDEIVRRSSDGATDDITAMVIRRL